MKFLAFCLLLTIVLFLIKPIINLGWRVLKPIIIGTIFLAMAMPEDVRQKIEGYNKDDFKQTKQEVQDIKKATKETINSEEFQAQMDSVKVWK